MLKTTNNEVYEVIKMVQDEILKLNQRKPTNDKNPQKKPQKPLKDYIKEIFVGCFLGYVLFVICQIRDYLYKSPVDIRKDQVSLLSEFDLFYCISQKIALAPTKVGHLNSPATAEQGEWMKNQFL